MDTGVNARPPGRARAKRPAAPPADPKPVWPPLTAAQKAAAREHAEASAEQVRKMTPAERKRLIADNARTLAELHAGDAASPESAASDLLLVLQAAGLEFLRRYYPTATGCTLYVTVPNPHHPLRHEDARFPIPTPAAGGAEGGAA